MFDTSPLTQFSKFNNFLRVGWFLGKNLSNFVPPVWNSTPVLPSCILHIAKFWQEFACWYLKSRVANVHQVFGFPIYCLSTQILNVSYTTELCKGQLISKCLFGVFNFIQKMNKNKSTWGITVVKSNLFVHFLEETSAWKNHFDFVWPLRKEKICIIAGRVFFLLKCRLVHC